MLARVECKECDLTICTVRFNLPDYISMKSLVDMAKDHYICTGHTLLKIVITLTDKDVKGE